MKSSIIVIFSVLFTMFNKAFGEKLHDNPYCKLSPLHTLCLYNKNTPGENCPPGIKYDPLDDREKSFIIQTHNEYRSAVATGQRIKNHCPAGADVLHMEWDFELEEIAEMWARQCPQDHDTFRHVVRFKVGQNIYVSSKPGNDSSHEPPVREVLEYWYSEFQNMTDDAFNGHTFAEVKHFTQIVWGKTKYLGCAKHFWLANGTENYFMSCNYGPRGNIKGEALYTPGKECTNCPERSICSSEEDREGLCTDQLDSTGTMDKSDLIYVSFGLCAVLIFYKHLF